MHLNWYKFWSTAACACSMFVGAVRADEIEMPRVLDDRLKIELFAAAPDIVTPTGIAVDRRGRAFVAESHTHFPPQGYDGPKTDRIRLFEDADGDGRAERVSNFYEGGVATMNIALDHTGALYVATRMELSRLRDTNDDGQADEKVQLAHLETKGDYPHNGLSGFAFDPLGWVYFGMGENLGADYTLVGSDGARLSGGGEGGNIFRFRPDGSQLERVATGFWNPFHLCIDAFGRLFGVDNDPDSRPPCRLLHIVPGGDYGYRYRNGRKGLHPFTAWNGELPGTLPMTAGTGEAPSGMTAYESDGLPQDYVGALLVTSWGDHRLERHKLAPHGASFRTQANPFVSGGENFRPVGIAVGPDGALYVSDWVDKSYELHKKGRVWKISAKDALPRPRPADPRQAILSAHRDTREDAARALVQQGEAGLDALDEVVASSASSPRARAVAAAALWNATRQDQTLAAERRDARLNGLGQIYRGLAAQGRDDSWLLLRMAQSAPALAVIHPTSEPTAFLMANAIRQGNPVAGVERPLPRLIDALSSDDPFVRQAGRRGIIRLSRADALGRELSSSKNASLRLEALLLLRDSGLATGAAQLPAFLADADPVVRFAAVQWVAERNLVELRPNVEKVLAEGAASRQLFEGCLAALELLAGIRRQQKDEIGGGDYVAQLLVAPGTAVEIRRRAIRMAPPTHPAIALDWLEGQLNGKDAVMRLEAVRTLRERPDPAARRLLATTAANAKEDATLRAEAVVGLRADEEEHRNLLLALASAESPPALRDEALRALRGATLSAAETDRLASLAGADAELREQVSRVKPDEVRFDRPANADVDAWVALLEQKEGNAAAGERVFFSSLARCSACHQRNGRGGNIGPEMTATGPQLARRRLVESMLLPSKEIAPQFVGWSIAAVDGRVLQGLLIREDVDGTQAYMDANGQVTEIKHQDIAERSPHNLSLMPENLPRSLTLQEFRDLLAYLSQGE